MKATRRLSWLMLVVLVTSMVLAACGGDEATSTPEPKEAEATQAPEATEAPVVDEEDDLLDQVTSAGKLVVSTDPNYAPQSFLDESGEFDGFDINVAQEVAERLGVELELMPVDWDLITPGGWAGRFDMSIGSMTPTEDRAEVLWFTDSYYFTPASFAVHKDNTDIQMVDDLSGKDLGLGAATTYLDWFNGELAMLGGEVVYGPPPDVNITEYSTDLEAVQDLALGDGVRLDAVLTAQPTIQNAIDEGVPIKYVGTPAFYEPLAFALDRDRGPSDEMVAKLNEILAEMHADGTLTELSEEWYGVDITKVIKSTEAGGMGEGGECTDEWGCAEFESGQTVKVGYVGPMTGDYSGFGTDISRGAELAVEANSDVLGYEIELQVEDTQGTPEQGAAVANLFASDPQMVAVDGHTFSGSTEVAIPIYEEAGIVMMSPSATTPELTERGSEIFNRVAFHDAMQAQFAAQYIYDVLGVREIAVMHDGSAYGQNLAELTSSAFEALGGTLVGDQVGITPGEADYSAPLNSVAALEPELIYYGGYDAEAAVLASQMPLVGLDDIILFGDDGTFSVNYLDLAGDAAEGSFATSVPIPESAAYDKYRTDYATAYGDEVGKLSPFSPHGYDSMAILLDAIDAVAVESDGKLIIPRKALAEAVRGTAGYDGLTGSITCSATGECAAASIVFMQVQDGEWVPGPGQAGAPAPEAAGPYECTDEWGCAEFESGQTVKVGYVGPMTGDYSGFGTDISRGAELAVEANSDVLGYEIELQVEDTQGTPEQGAAVANLFASDPQMVAVDGHTFSGSTEVAIPIYEEAGIVMMSPSATTPELTERGSEIFNRVAFHDAMQAQFAAQYIYDVLGVREIAVMHDGSAYGQNLAELTSSAFEALGGTLVGDQVGITPGEADYSAPLNSVAALEPELIYYGGYDAEAAVLASQMPLVGLDDIILFGDDGTFSVNYLDLAGDAAEGSFATSVPIPESAAYDKYRTDYATAYGDEVGKLSPFSPHGFDSMAILLDAIDAVAVESDGKLIIPRKALAEAVRGTAGYDGLTGSITCSATGECAAASIVFMQVQDGEWVPGPGQ